jgi:hypothetical protein
MPLLKEHYVYHLLHRKNVVYVGRSTQPKVRRTIFERKHGFRPEQVVHGPYALKTAQQLEKDAIRLLRPKFNKYVASSPSNLGQAQCQQNRRRQCVEDYLACLRHQHTRPSYGATDRARWGNLIGSTVRSTRLKL